MGFRQSLTQGNHGTGWIVRQYVRVDRRQSFFDLATLLGDIRGEHFYRLSLGDVYLGAPVATPLDPRHRLVTTKYNPARTWTPHSTV